MYVHQSCLQFNLLTVTQMTMMLQKCIIDRDTDSQANNPQTKKNSHSHIEVNIQIYCLIVLAR